MQGSESQNLRGKMKNIIKTWYRQFEDYQKVHYKERKYKFESMPPLESLKTERQLEIEREAHYYIKQAGKYNLKVPNQTKQQRSQRRAAQRQAYKRREAKKRVEFLEKLSNRFFSHR